MFRINTNDGSTYDAGPEELERVRTDDLAGRISGVSVVVKSEAGEKMIFSCPRPPGCRRVSWDLSIQVRSGKQVCEKVTCYADLYAIHLWVYSGASPVFSRVDFGREGRRIQRPG